MNPVLIAISITLDSIVLGKQRVFGLAPLMLSACLIHVFAFGTGLMLGEQFVMRIGHVDHWVALAVFGLLGLSCVKSAVFVEGGENPIIKSWPKLTLVVFGLSIDAVAVGATSEGLITEPLATLVAVGLCAPMFVYVGRKLSRAITGNRARTLRLVEGCLFWTIGASIVISHTQGGF
jgi:putative Mn2+ efflux pump MntP